MDAGSESKPAYVPLISDTRVQCDPFVVHQRHVGRVLRASATPEKSHEPPKDLPLVAYRRTFLASYEQTGSAVFSGRVALFPLDKLTAVKISDENDFRLAEALLRQHGADPG